MTVDKDNEHDKGRMLLALARSTLASELGLPSSDEVDTPDWLQQPGACFVTLRADGELRGCIGSLEAYRPLGEDLRSNCLAAAFRDPRFPPLSAPELERTSIEVSLLSPLRELAFNSETDALAQLRPGVDGLVLECEGHRGTFLPAVWASLSEPRLFLAKLKAKARLPEDFWSPSIRLHRYTTTTFSETEARE